MISQRILAAALLATALLGPAGAETYTVDTPGDTAAVNPAVGPQDATGHISLRSAIQAANLKPGADTVALAAGVVYALTLGPEDSAIGALNGAAGDLDIIDSLTIQGNGAKVNATGIDRAFAIEAAAPGVSVTFNDLAITGGHARGFLAAGGGISVRAAALTLNRCSVTFCTADGNGGGIAVNGVFGPPAIAGALTLNECTVSGNTAANGANILAAASSLTVDGTTIYGGSATGDFGGAGLALLGDAATSKLTNVTVADNTASAGGGGGAATFGGGAHAFTYATVAGNKATQGGGIRQIDAKVALKGSLVARNGATAAAMDLSGTFISDGYNLVGDRTGATITAATGDLLGGPPAAVINPLLGPLQGNGGPVFTQALLPGSPAIDAGDPLNFPPRDARRFRRPQDGDKDKTARADIGAYELVPPYTADDIARALRLAAGLQKAEPADMPRLDLTLPEVVDAADAVVIARKLAGLGSNP